MQTCPYFQIIWTPAQSRSRWKRVARLLREIVWQILWSHSHKPEPRPEPMNFRTNWMV